MEKTTIEVSDKTWTRLNRLKGRGETFDDVVGELLSKANEESNK